jgi:hypothetical protein
MFRNKEGVSGAVRIRTHSLRKHKDTKSKNVRKCSFLFRIGLKWENKFSKGPPLLEATENYDDTLRKLLKMNVHMNITNMN